MRYSLKPSALKYLVDENPARIVELAKLICALQYNRDKLVLEEHELLCSLCLCGELSAI